MLKRHIKKILFEALEYMPVVLLRGARQTGKTTLVKSLLLEDGYKYISFDHIPSLMSAKNDPVGFISNLEKPIILDEIQRVPELFLPIKTDVDENRKPGRYILTGSADPLLVPKLGDSLAGRMRLLNLWPLSQGEILGIEENFLERAFSSAPILTRTNIPCSKKDLLERCFNGGYPAPLNMTKEQRQNWFNDYISLVLQKDLLDLSQIENITNVPNLLTLLASRVGGLLNTEELSRSLKLSSMTLARYMDLLKALFLIYLLPPWSSNLGKRITKSSKIYLTDTALQLYLLNMDMDHIIKDLNLWGKVIENFVILELLKQLSWTRLNIKMYHYREYSGSEIDVILEGPGKDLVAIEIKSSESISSDDFKGLRAFQGLVKEKFLRGFLLYGGNTVLPFGDKLTALPISSLWSNQL
ncbi:MAG: ATP-binding protein [Chlamydiae bacterium]|nr:ATP-binding protein [Chlamydiota bacterium]